MIPGFMGSSGEQNIRMEDQKLPGQFKNREEVIQATRKVQPEIIDPQHIMHKMALIFQLSAMGIVDKQAQAKLNKIAKYSFLSLFSGFGIAIGGWKVGNLLLKSVNRRVRVLGRSLLSISFFFLPQKLLYEYIDKSTSQLHQDYTERYIQFMLTADLNVFKKQEKIQKNSDAQK